MCSFLLHAHPAHHSAKTTNIVNGNDLSVMWALMYKMYNTQVFDRTIWVLSRTDNSLQIHCVESTHMQICPIGLYLYMYMFWNYVTVLRINIPNNIL